MEHLGARLLLQKLDVGRNAALVAQILGAVLELGVTLVGQRDA